jgi:hypothetical protein
MDTVTEIDTDSDTNMDSDTDRDMQHWQGHGLGHRLEQGHGKCNSLMLHTKNLQITVKNLLYKQR